MGAASIGIEFHVPGYANGDGSNWYKFTPFTKGQTDTGIQLVAHLMEAHAITKQNLLGHSTISVGRKTDPGPLFPWKAFSDQGLGYLPQPKDSDIKVEQSEETIKFVQSKLSEIGFVLCPNSTTLDATTQNHIDAYVMQFATDLWTGNNVAITQELIDSINGFNATITSLPLVGVEVYSDGIALAA